MGPSWIAAKPDDAESDAEDEPITGCAQLSLRLRKLVAWMSTAACSPTTWTWMRGLRGEAISSKALGLPRAPRYPTPALLIHTKSTSNLELSVAQRGSGQSHRQSCIMLAAHASGRG